MALPIADGAADVTLSSNVLEHVPEPERMADEMLRVTRPGGLVYVSWTPWLSPWGGHETSPWHYLGGTRAADRYTRKHHRRPKNDYGRSLHACSVARMHRRARAQLQTGRITELRMLPRYHPRWAQWLIDVPAVREVAAWNAVVVMRRSSSTVRP
jgi:SAM-dependent methyltransferase